MDLDVRPWLFRVVSDDIIDRDAEVWLQVGLQTHKSVGKRLQQESVCLPVGKAVVEDLVHYRSNFQIEPMDDLAHLVGGISDPGTRYSFERYGHLFFLAPS
jgi:hypothetical protein